MRTPTLLRSTFGNVPPREFMRDVPKHFDGGDIDHQGHWHGAAMCCLDCGETRPMRLGITPTYQLMALECGECYAIFAEVWQ